MGMTMGPAQSSGTTIVAISSPPGPAQRGVLRVSGPGAVSLLRQTVLSASGGHGLDDFLSQRGLLRTRFDDGIGTQPVLVLWMPGPHSYTREDVFELHLPGAQPLLEVALERLLSLGARRAERGEFTRRAFLNGRIDLTRAEGVLELVSASTELESRAATELLSGGLANRVGVIRSGLEALRALTEASLDFDESDTGHVPREELCQALARTLEQLQEALGWELRRQSPSALPRVVLVGAPNAGKSTLFNALVEDGNALVSDHAGTTRDVIAGLWDLAPAESPRSLPVLLIDTAGEDDLAAGVDGEAQAFAARAARGADLLLHLVAPLDSEDSGGELVPDVLEGPFGAQASEVLRVGTKADSLPSGKQHPGISISVQTGSGLGDLRQAVALALGFLAPTDTPQGPAGQGADPGGEPTQSRGSLGAELFLRHRTALVEAQGATERAAEALQAGVPLDLVAEAMREGTDALDSIEGRTSPEDLLDRIFARFCLGK
ncbi:MAG: tRNA modification GTPase [Planctomycetota bacterium]|jgi:tRNA modification GTPase